MRGSGWRLAALGAALVAAAISGCSGGSSGNSGDGSPACSANCPPPPPTNLLTVADVQRIVAQAVGEATARNSPAVITVVDRVGNVLAVYEMNGAPKFIAISSGLGVTGGLDGIPTGIVPAALSSIAKAVTGAFLSSQGNAFTTRTASQIVQEHFLPHESQQPSGPLFGVQFSQLTCSDVNRNMTQGTIGPQRSPLGLSADPGGMPLYKNGVVVGGIGVEANGLYTIDRNIQDRDEDPEELIAVAGSSGFEAPVDRRADHITAGGVTFRYVDSDAIRSNPAQAAPFASLPGHVLEVPNYSTAAVRAGTAYGTPASGIVPATGALATVGAYVLVNTANVNRFPPRASTDGQLTATDVETILVEAVKIANRARAQILRPLGSPAQVSFTVVGTNGDILGLTRTSDGPLFGIDVSAQKARGALLISSAQAAALLLGAPDAEYLKTLDPLVTQPSSIASYVPATRAFLGDNSALTGNTAWSMRAIGNIHRPFFPDGLDTSVNGPFSKPISAWSPFNVGLQLDLVNNQLLKAILGDLSEGCAGRAFAGKPETADPRGISIARNGIQIFPGGVPIYRNGVLAGAIGISGDGVDQDDMIAFLGLHNAGLRLGNGVGNAPMERRADNLTPQGVRLRYVQCPQAPFNDSDEQNACAGK